MLNQIIQDKSRAHLHDIFNYHLISVCHDLTDEQAQHLAHWHNRTTEFSNKMTTQDKILSHM